MLHSLSLSFFFALFFLGFCYASVLLFVTHKQERNVIGIAQRRVLSLHEKRADMVVEERPGRV